MTLNIGFILTGSWTLYWKMTVFLRYQYAKYIEYPGNGHAGFQASKPKEYAEYLKEIVKGY